MTLDHGIGVRIPASQPLLFSSHLWENNNILVPQTFSPLGKRRRF